MTDRPEVRFLDRTTPPHIITLVLMAGVGAMNMSSFLPALPDMTAYFGTRYEVMQLAVTLYLAGVAVFQLAVGPISDKFGRRSVTLAGLGVFVVATLGCIFAPTVEVFLLFRVVQTSAAVGIALSRAIVRDMVPQDEAASMIGYVTMGMALVPMVAPMIGGALDQAFGWQAIFWMLAITGTAVFVLCWFDQGETARGGGLSFAAQVKEYPELFTSRRFWGYVFASAFASGAFFAFLGGGPYVASTEFGLSSFWAGVCFGAPAVGYAIGNYVSGRYSVHFGINWMIRTGALIGFLGLGCATLMTFIGGGSAILFFGFCCFVGLGNGMVIPNASAGMLSVRPHLAGTASGLGGAIMIGGGAALAAVSGVVIQSGAPSLRLLLIMTATMFLGLLSILYVITRERQLEALE
ncbi:MAG: multidrug effflux MFS transporter [Pseudomonadota bacterium]